MNTKTICAVILALLAGVLIGYLIWGGEPEPPPTPPTRGEEWPMVPCPPDESVEGQMAFDVCDRITQLASAVQPATPESMNCAIKAQSKKSGNPPDPMMASATLFEALQAAERGDWAMCEQGLDTIPD